MVFKKEDLNQLSQKGISIDTALKQIENFKTGFPFIQLAKACTPNDGISILSQTDLKEYISIFEGKSKNLSLMKFIPASGAASRMFKDLFSFLSTKEHNATSQEVITNLQSFAFYNSLLKVAQENNITLNTGDLEGQLEIVNLILTEKGLNYGNLPKGLIEFHRYSSVSRTAFAEHMIEGNEYSKDKNNTVNLHFTISEEHKEAIAEHIQYLTPKFEKEFNCNYNISFSTQSPSTDTLATDLENNPFRNEKGEILFRPGGHGALIENLNAIEGDLIFIKNIDNVVPDSLKPTTYDYKKALAGYLLDKQSQLFSFLELLDNADTTEVPSEIITFCNNELQLDISNLSPTQVKNHLNKPIRVCGMVKNEGEPGGGPFWVVDEDSTISRQIVESSQIDMDKDKDLVTNSTHFNPVDLICAVKDYQGNKFDLMKFIDTKTGFISYKSKDAKDLKAQELPGLWNGAMAKWITFFVEVPLITFNPVKTISDLLREEHQKD